MDQARRPPEKPPPFVRCRSPLPSWYHSHRPSSPLDGGADDDGFHQQRHLLLRYPPTRAPSTPSAARRTPATTRVTPTISCGACTPRVHDAAAAAAAAAASPCSHNCVFCLSATSPRVRSIVWHRSRSIIQSSKRFFSLGRRSATLLFFICFFSSRTSPRGQMVGPNYLPLYLVQYDCPYDLGIGAGK